MPAKPRPSTTEERRETHYRRGFVEGARQAWVHLVREGFPPEMVESWVNNDLVLWRYNDLNHIVPPPSILKDPPE